MADENGLEPRRAFTGRVTPFDEFVGRADELAELTTLLSRGEVRLITLTGPSGVGKTRLASELGRDLAGQFADGAVFVPLVGVDASARVLPAIARALAILDDEQRLPALLKQHLRDRHLLLILDNFEHLKPAAPDLHELSTACVRVTMLVTSRQPLHVDGELVVPIAPLPVPEPNVSMPQLLRANPAVRLFVIRGSSLRGAVPIADDDLDDIAAICRRVDGLPLAIELAAAWSRVLRPGEMRRRIDQQFSLLRGGTERDDTRHRTMREAVAWSYGLLSSEQQSIFRRLSVFAGGFVYQMVEGLVRSRDAGSGYPFAEGYGLSFPFTRFLGHDPTAPPFGLQDPAFALPLAAIPLDPLDGLAALVDQSLVHRVDNPADGVARFAFLEPIRAFGLEQLAEAGEEPATRHAHAAVMLAFAEASSEGILGKGSPLWDRSRIERELPNLRAALRWATEQGGAGSELALRLAANQWGYWQTSGMAREGADWLTRALDLGGGPEWCRALALPALGFLAWVQGDDQRAKTALDEGLDLATRLGLLPSEASAHFYRALVAWREGPAALFAMLEHLEQALDLFRAAEDPIGTGVCNLALGVVRRMSGDTEGALALFEEARRLFVDAGYAWGISSARYYAGEAVRDVTETDPARLPEAVALLSEALNGYVALGDNWGTGGVVSAFASIAAGRGASDQAARLFGAADAMLARIGAFLPPTDLDAYRATAADLRDQMGGKSYDRSYHRGQTLGFDDAIRESLAIADEIGEGTSPMIAVPPSPPARLTKKQLSVVRLLVAGLDPEQIAVKRGVWQQGVYQMAARICQRWHLDEWTEIAPFAIAHGVVRSADEKNVE